MKHTYIPIADTGDRCEGVTVTVIGLLDVPPVVVTTTSINPDDSEPVNCPDAKFTTNTSNQLSYSKDVTYNNYDMLTGRVSDHPHCCIPTTCSYCWSK